MNTRPSDRALARARRRIGALLWGAASVGAHDSAASAEAGMAHPAAARAGDANPGNMEAGAEAASSAEAATGLAADSGPIHAAGDAALRSADAALAGDAGAPADASAAPDARRPEADASVLTDAAAQQPEACASGRAHPGEEHRQITSGGRARTFITYRPSSLEPGRPAPVVLIFHGALMTAESMRDLTGFEQLADVEGFIAVFPDGDSLTWNVRLPDTQVCGIGEVATNPEADDIRFVDEMLADIEKSHCIDRGHIFATGFSMGGYFTNHLACQRPELLRAAAPQSSGTYEGACKGWVPMLIIHGTGDIGVDLECGLETRALWLERNGCSPQIEREGIKRGHCERHVGCAERGQVTLCLLDGMCHGVAGHGTGALLCGWDFGGGPDYEDATALIWRFFEKHW